MFFSVLATAALMASTLAAPAAKTYGCDVSSARLVLPSSSGISIPSGVKPKYIVLGVGTQNSTCNSAGTYASAGAVASLVDLSCAYEYGDDIFNTAQTEAYNQYPAWELVTYPYTYTLGKHYFISQNGSIAPKFDFTQTGNGYTVTKKIGGVASPEGSKNVDWLELQSTSGGAGQYVFRVATRGGQPPASCKAGQTVTVKYAAKYWFFN
ncbi:hypothetical protein RSAG8_12614, partial [Rhizoctonia solani AG-8 WAC10335]